MNTTELIEIVKECCSYPVKVSDYHWCGEGEFIFTEAGLNAFAQRIEAPHLQRIAELEKDCEILQTNLDAALTQVKQLREALHKAATELTKSGWNCGNLFDEIDKALEQSC